MQRGIVTIQRVVVIVHRAVALLQRGIVNMQRGIVNMQRGVVTAHRLVAGLHQGKVFLRCPEQRERREKTYSHCLIPLDIQHKTTEQRAENEIHQAKVSRLPLAAACIRSIALLHLPPKVVLR